MKWYNVNEHIPKTRDTGAGWGYYESKPILVTDGKIVCLARYLEIYDNEGKVVRGWFDSEQIIVADITHWMSLPRLPEQDV